MALLYTMEIDQNAYWRRIFIWQDQNYNPVPLVGYTAKIEIRKEKGTNYPVLLTLDNGSNGGIILDPESGAITVAITAAQTAALNIARGYFDLLLTDEYGTPYRLLNGPVSVDGATTT